MRTLSTTWLTTTTPCPSSSASICRYDKPIYGPCRDPNKSQTFSWANSSPKEPRISQSVCTLARFIAYVHGSFRFNARQNAVLHACIPDDQIIPASEANVWRTVHRGAACGCHGCTLFFVLRKVSNCKSANTLRTSDHLRIVRLVGTSRHSEKRPVRSTFPHTDLPL